MDKYILTWATKYPQEGALLCGVETIASKTACRKIVQSYKKRADYVSCEWEGGQFPYGEYTELRMADGTELLLCIEPMRFLEKGGYCAYDI